MEKPRRSRKMMDYAAMENGDSDDSEDFLPVISKKKRPKEVKENLKKSDDESAFGPRLSPAEKRYKRDIEAAIDLSICTDENKENSISVINEEEQMPSTSWGLTAKRQRKQIKSYHEGPLESSDEFEGWAGSSDSNDFSPSSPVINKRKFRKGVKVKKNIKTRNSNVVLVPNKTEKTLAISTTSNVQMKEDRKSNEIFVESVKNETYSSGKQTCSSAEEEMIPEELVSMKNEQTAEANKCSVQLVKLSSPVVNSPPLELVTLPTSPVVNSTPFELIALPTSPIVRTKTSPKETPIKTKQPLVEVESSTTNVVKGIKKEMPSFRKITEKCSISSSSISSPLVKSSFKLPMNSGSPQLNSDNNSITKTGLRLGLSRKGNFKCLHPKASIS